LILILDQLRSKISEDELCQKRQTPPLGWCRQGKSRILAQFRPGRRKAFMKEAA